jgi:hypothetical protein
LKLKLGFTCADPHVAAPQASSLLDEMIATSSSTEVHVQERQDTNSLTDILTEVLRKLGRQNSLDEHLRYLHSEWLTTEQDLKACIQDDKAWRDLQLPSRLKLALKEECKRRDASTSVTSSIPAPIALQTLVASDAYSNMLQQELEDDKASALAEKAASERIEHKANDTEEEEEMEEDDEGFLDQVNQKWVKSYSPEHKSAYFFNEITEETVWELPKGVEPSRVDEWAASLLSQVEHAAPSEDQGEVEERVQEEGNASSAIQEQGEEQPLSAEVLESLEEDKRHCAAKKARQLAREKAEEAQAIKAVAKSLAAERATARSTGEASSEVVDLPSAHAPNQAMEGALRGLCIEGPLPVPPPTAYTQPHTLDIIPSASPSAPTLPAELLGLEAEVVPTAVSVQGTPLGSPGQPATVAVPLEQNFASELEVRYDDGEEEEEEEEEEQEEQEEEYADLEVDLGLLQMLTDMGFNEDVAATALQRNDNDLELATNACLTHDLELATNACIQHHERKEQERHGSHSSRRRVMNSSEYMRALSESEGDRGSSTSDRPRSADKPYRGRPMQRLSRFLGRMTTSAKRGKAQSEDLGIDFGT